jgi:hypothetical protein
MTVVRPDDLDDLEVAEAVLADRHGAALARGIAHTSGEASK